MRACVVPLFLLLPLTAAVSQSPVAADSTLNKYTSQYAPYEMTFDARSLSPHDKQILRNLIKASEYLDTVFWMQTSRSGLALRDSIAKHPRGARSETLLTLLNRNTGPFELLNEYAPFVGDRTFYPGQELYPQGMAAAQFDAYVATLPPATREEFMSPYTVIRRGGANKYVAVPYHVAYTPYITRIAGLLTQSAALSDNPSFAKFLALKAKALQTDRYFDADVAWIDMERTTFDMVFGPFETYADGIKGVKAKYESNIEIVDRDESRKLDMYRSHLAEMEDNLPIPAEYKSEVKGLTAKFVIVRDVIRTGESASGYQAVATNLPNDPVVQKRKGTVKTFWKNMFEARFNAIIKPVSLRLIDPSQQQYLSDEGFFLAVLMHEICHALGPRVVKAGPNTGMAVNASIGPGYSALEEEKADVTGLHSLALLIDKGVIDKSMERQAYVSYLGGLLRSVRFGLNEAHGKAAAMELNYLWKQGAIRYDAATHRWSVDFGSIRDGVKSLTSDLLLLEGNGDGARVKEFSDAWIYMTPELQGSLDQVSDIAIDVIPHYVIKWE